MNSRFAPACSPTAKRSDAVADMLTRVMAHQPFFGSYFYSDMALIETLDIPTAATDGKTLYFNPEFMATLTLEERVFVFCHEVLHGIMMHCERGKYWHQMGQGPDGTSYDHELNNKAADYIINSVLKKSQIGHMPKNGLYRHDVDGTWILEDVYKLLAKEKEDNPPPPPNGGGGDEQGEGESEDGHGGFDEHFIPEGEARDANEARASIEAAIQTAKMVGELPAELERAISTIMEPKVSWEEELRKGCEEVAGCDEVTWRRPHRRRLAVYDQYMPRRTAYATGGAAVILDMSGSIGTEEVAQFLGEVSSILSQCRPEWLKVLWVDTKVSGVDDVEEAEDLPFLDPKGGGGTDMGAGLRYIRDEMDDKPETIIVLTDGYTPWGEEPDDSKLIWGITTKTILAPFGQTIHVEMD